MAYDGKFFKISFDMANLNKLNEIYTSYFDAQQNSLFKKWVYTAKTA